MLKMEVGKIYMNGAGVRMLVIKELYPNMFHAIDADDKCYIIKDYNGKNIYKGYDVDEKGFWGTSINPRNLVKEVGSQVSIPKVWYW